MSHSTTTQTRRPTAQELRELQTVFELERLSDDYITTEIADLVSTLQFEAAEIRMAYDYLLESSRQKEDYALLVWKAQHWVMVMKRLPDSGLPNIHWLCVFNCDVETLMQEAHSERTV